jgi:homeodomain-containing protein
VRRPGGGAGPDRAVGGRRRDAGQADRRDGGLCRANRGDLARPLRRTWPGGLADLPRPGKPSPLPEALRDRVLELTLTAPPTQYGATHWSSRLLARALANEGTPISHATIARIWHRFGVQPWRTQTFKFSTDPELEGKDPRRRRAVPASAGEGCGAVRRRKAPAPPAGADRADAARAAGASGNFDYIRHGTTTLFAALEVATGRVTDVCTERHRHQEFLAFLKQVCPCLSAPRAARGG